MHTLSTLKFISYTKLTPLEVRISSIHKILRSTK